MSLKKFPTSSRINAILNNSETVSTENKIEKQLLSLLQGHRIQWDAEDLSRDAESYDEVGRIKCQIDELNASRTRTILSIDSTVSPNYYSKVRRQPRCPETLGSIIDRLVISFVRIEKLSLERYKSRLTDFASEQYRELLEAYEDMLTMAQNGDIALPRSGPLKKYGKSEK